jgi:hypothetical protein
MVEEYQLIEMNEIEHLIQEHKWLKTVIQYAFREKKGKVYVTDINDPEVAFLHLGFVFLGGDTSSSQVAQLVEDLPAGPQLIVPNLAWASTLADVLGERVKPIQRFGFSHDSLSLDHLRALKEKLPPEFTLERIDLDTAKAIPRALAPAIPFFFGSPESFIEHGFGYCIKHDGVVVSTAMTAMPFEREFEIEVDTMNSADYRRKGLATAASAALLEHALVEDLVPIWDAANEASKALALKLGYSNLTPYGAFTKNDNILSC